MISMGGSVGGSSGVDRGSCFMRWSRDMTVHSNAEATHLLLCGGLLRIEDEQAALERLAQDIGDGRANYVVERRTPVFRLCQDYDFLTVEPGGIPLVQFKEYMAVVQREMQLMFPHLPPEHLYVIVCHAPLKKQSRDVKITVMTCEATQTEAAAANQIRRLEDTRPTNIENKTEQQELTKSGFHAIWPHVYVDRETAIRIRFVLKQRLEQLYPKFGQIVVTAANVPEKTAATTTTVYDKWSDVLDLTVYVENGLRMLGSSKAVKCKTCKPKQHRRQEQREKRECADCSLDGSARGYIDQGRPYCVTGVIRSDGSVDSAQSQMLRANPLLALQLTTIRCTRGETLTQPLVLPAWFTDGPEAESVIRRLTGGNGISGNGAAGRKRQQRTGGNGGERALLQGGDWGTPGEIKMVQVGNRSCEFEVASLNDPRTIAFERFIDDAVPHGVERLYVRKIIISRDVDKPYIYAVGSTKYCINVEREHTGQDVYYVFNGRTVEQRCWSVKDGPDRKHGPCKERAAQKFFKSSATKMPKDVFRVIFPLSGIGAGAGAGAGVGNGGIQQQYLQFHPSETPPPMLDSRATFASSTAPANRHPTCTPEMMQLESMAQSARMLCEAYMHPRVPCTFYYDSASSSDTDNANNDNAHTDNIGDEIIIHSQ